MTNQPHFKTAKDDFAALGGPPPFLAKMEWWAARHEMLMRELWRVLDSRSSPFDKTPVFSRVEGLRRLIECEIVSLATKGTESGLYSKKLCTAELNAIRTMNNKLQAEWDERVAAVTAIETMVTRNSPA